LPLSAAKSGGLELQKSPSVVQGQSSEGLGEEVPRS